MTQTCLDRCVARATGETLDTIRRRGFSLADPDTVSFDPEPCPSPQVVDWDELDAKRRTALFPSRHIRRPIAA